MKNQNYNYNYTLNLVIQKWKIVRKLLNGFIEKQRLNKCFLNNVTNIQSQRRKRFQKKALLVGYAESVLSIKVILKSLSNP